MPPEDFSPHEQRQQEIYDGRSALYQAEAFPTPDGMPSLLLTYREHCRMLRRLEIVPGQVVLDIGCSSGQFLNFVASRYGARGVGIDISKVAIEAAATRNPDMTFRVGTAERRLDFADRSFDRVMCFDVIEHLQRPGDAIAEIFRVLKPDGRALFHIPVADLQGSADWINRWRDPIAWQRLMDEAGHDYSVMLTRAGYEALMKRAGFRIIVSRRFNAMLQNVFDYRMVHRVLNRLFFRENWKVPFGIYHKAIAPLVELAVSPDRVLQAANIGASIYLIVGRPER